MQMPAHFGYERLFMKVVFEKVSAPDAEGAVIKAVEVTEEIRSAVEASLLPIRKPWITERL